MRLTASALLVLAIGYVWSATNIPLDPWAAEEMVNSRTLPLAYGTALALACLVALVWPGPAVPARNAVAGRRVGWLVTIMLGFAIAFFVLPASLWSWSGSSTPRCSRICRCC